MLGILVLLAISWLLIWLFEKGNLSVLGFIPPAGIVKLALLLFLLTAICCASGYLLKIYFHIDLFQLNENISPGLFFKGIWNNLKSVLTEELLCRGVGLYILVKKLGSLRGILISSVIFGMLHWFDSGVWGNIPQMIMLFGFTFFMGLILAYSYVKTGSILVPIAIHLGWNLTQNFIFSDGPFEAPLLVRVHAPAEVTVSYFMYFIIVFFPELSAIILNYLVLRKFPKKLLYDVKS